MFTKNGHDIVKFSVELSESVISVRRVFKENILH